MTAADWGANAITKAPGFREATAVLELGAGDFSRSLALAERYPDKRFLSTDYEISAQADANLPAVATTPNIEVTTIDARTIDVPAGSIDFMFSIALMEHIAELEECVEAAHRALGPGGVYFYIQAPFWTCAQGHHFRHDDDRTYDYIPKYAHLTHDRDGLLDVLLAGPAPPFDPHHCVDTIYRRPDLSRLGLKATKAIVASGPLALASWSENADRRYDESLARAAFPALRVPVAFEELAVAGAEVVLRKPGGPSGAAGRLARRLRRGMSRRRSAR